jgi:CDP-glucose 4,6-dehydratase
MAQSGAVLASVRAGNVIGGGDWTANQLVPDLIRAFQGRRPCRIRNPAAIRPWQFVMEPLHGYLLLCEKLAAEGSRFASGWNFGPAQADAKPVSWIADTLATSWGDGASWVYDGGKHPGEAQMLRLDISKATADLDWAPVLPLPRALEWIVEWYSAFAAGDDIRSITNLQIERYQDLLQGSTPRNSTASGATAAGIASRSGRQ